MWDTISATSNAPEQLEHCLCLPRPPQCDGKPAMRWLTAKVAPRYKSLAAGQHCLLCATLLISLDLMKILKTWITSKKPCSAAFGCKIPRGWCPNLVPSLSAFCGEHHRERHESTTPNFFTFFSFQTKNQTTPRNNAIKHSQSKHCKFTKPFPAVPQSLPPQKILNNIKHQHHRTMNAIKI